MLGSRNEDRVVNANFNPDGNLNVNSNLKPENRNPNLGGRSEIVSCYIWRYFKKLGYLLVLLIFSILRAFYLFLVEIVRAGDIFCDQAP